MENLLLTGSATLGVRDPAQGNVTASGIADAGKQRFLSRQDAEAKSRT
jgi:hypothetical protein